MNNTIPPYGLTAGYEPEEVLTRRSLPAAAPVRWKPGSSPAARQRAAAIRKKTLLCAAVMVGLAGCWIFYGYTLDAVLKEGCPALALAMVLGMLRILSQPNTKA